MAELSQKALLNFAAASSAMMLVESLRLIRNYKYYNNISDNTVSRTALLEQIRYTRRLAFSLHNLMEKDETDEAPFYVSIAGAIYDAFEEIHRSILFFDPEDIVSIIPGIDEQRSFWSGFCDTEFYNGRLIHQLEDIIPKKIIDLETKIKGLPSSPDVSY